MKKDDINLSGVFGMCEMESAAKAIIERAHELNKKDVRVCASLFQNDHLMTGFLHLVYFGEYMDCGYYNGEFVPSEAFWNRIPQEYHP